MTDRCLHGMIRNAEGHRLFGPDPMIKPDTELKRYGYRMALTHHIFLTCREAGAEACCRVRKTSVPIDDGIPACDAAAGIEKGMTAWRGGRGTGGPGDSGSVPGIVR